MKKYNLNKEKISFKWGEALGYSLGEEGRGRKKTLVIDRSETENVKPIITKNGGFMIVDSDSESNSWLALLSTNGGYKKNVDGYFKACESDNIKIFAMGNGAWGDAGRCGTYDEAIIEIPDNTWIMLRMSGHSENYYMYFGTKEVHKITVEEIGAFCDMMNIEAPDRENMIALR